jgi:hypothetical protein
MQRCEHGRFLERCYPCRTASGMAPRGTPKRVGRFPQEMLRPGVAASHVGRSGAVVHAVGVTSSEGATSGERICSGGPSAVVEGSLVLVTCKTCRSRARLA